MTKDYIISTIMINNVPQESYDQGFEDFLQDLDDPVVFSHFMKKFNVTEGLSIETHEDNAGYNVPCITVYFDYNSWNSWTDEMKEFWDKLYHPEIQKIEKNEWNMDCISSKLSDEEVDNLIIPMEELQSRFPNV